MDQLVVQLEDDDADNWEYMVTEEEDAIQEKKDRCFLAKLFKANGIGMFDVACFNA